ncbi:hypothetical protein KDX01_29485 [Burkholderia vietnamiensis]|uniref:hypothetical protein n=1 Tax=Burkholderia vietnamiensis TaxID=60552 RepID=UPI001B9F43DE|nr:hypothetical protein [Burkholderia vietnamiensis]MBR7977232.1 hypothetical protein [Burkholderia vietnamiensis]
MNRSERRPRLRTSFVAKLAVALDDVLAPVRDPVPRGHAAASCCAAVRRPPGKRFRMIGEPVEPVERILTIHFFEFARQTAGRLVISGIAVRGAAGSCIGATSNSTSALSARSCGRLNNGASITQRRARTSP